MSDSTNMRVHKNLEAKLKKIKLMTGMPMVKITYELADQIKNPAPFEIKIIGINPKKEKK